MAGRLLEDDPEAAYAHAVAAQKRAGRIGSVREAAGLAAYATGRFDEALRELRTARRLTGSDVHLPVLADCERGLGRPERALALAAAPEVAGLDQEGRVEMRMVAAGARLDMQQADAAVVTLQGPELQTRGDEPWRARLLSAYADALAAAGRSEEARDWASRADAAERSLVARGLSTAPAPEPVIVYDLEDDEDDEGGDAGPSGPDAPSV